MKSKILVAFALTAIAAVGFALVSLGIDVPKQVLAAFSVKYPSAQKVKWGLEDEGEYEAEFKFNGEQMSANFSSDGSWLMTERKIDDKKLPPAIKKTLASEFPGYKIEGSEQVETPDQPMAYELDLENKSDGMEIELLISADGTILKKEMKKEDDEQDKKKG